jgi:hypothetical protein
MEAAGWAPAPRWTAVVGWTPGSLSQRTARTAPPGDEGRQGRQAPLLFLDVVSARAPLMADRSPKSGRLCREGALLDFGPIVRREEILILPRARIFLSLRRVLAKSQALFEKPPPSGAGPWTRCWMWLVGPISLSTSSKNKPFWESRAVLLL